MPLFCYRGCGRCEIVPRQVRRGEQTPDGSIVRRHQPAKVSSLCKYSSPPSGVIHPGISEKLFLLSQEYWQFTTCVHVLCCSGDEDEPLDPVEKLRLATQENKVTRLSTLLEISS